MSRWNPTDNLGQNKWNIWTTPPPISMMPKWRVFCSFAPSSLLWEGWGIIVPFYTVQDCRFKDNVISFCRLTESLLHFNQTSKLHSSSFSMEGNLFGSEWEQKILVSSAKRKGCVYLEVFGRSLIYRMKNKGPNTELWGTPHLIVCYFKQTSFSVFAFIHHSFFDDPSHKFTYYRSWARSCSSGGNSTGKINIVIRDIDSRCYEEV